MLFIQALKVKWRKNILTLYARNSRKIIEKVSSYLTRCQLINAVYKRNSCLKMKKISKSQSKHDFIYKQQSATYMRHI